MTNNQHDAHHARDQDCLLPLCWRAGISPDSRTIRLIPAISSPELKSRLHVHYLDNIDISIIHSIKELYTDEISGGPGA